MSAGDSQYTRQTKTLLILTSSVVTLLRIWNLREHFNTNFANTFGYLFLKDIFFLAYNPTPMAHDVPDRKLRARSNHELEVSGHTSQRCVTEKHDRALPGPVGRLVQPPSTLVRPWARKKTTCPTSKTDRLDGSEHCQS